MRAACQFVAEPGGVVCSQCGVRLSNAVVRRCGAYLCNPAPAPAPSDSPPPRTPGRRDPLACVHLGAATGATVMCGCRQRWKTPLYACAIHGRCTPLRGTQEHPLIFDCRRCREYAVA